MSEIDAVKIIIIIVSFLITWTSGFYIGFIVRTHLYEKNPKIVYLVEKDKEKEK